MSGFLQDLFAIKLQMKRNLYNLYCQRWLIQRSTRHNWKYLYWPYINKFGMRLIQTSNTNVFSSKYLMAWFKVPCRYKYFLVFSILVFWLDTHHQEVCFDWTFFQDLQQSVFNAEMIEEQGFDVNMVRHNWVYLMADVTKTIYIYLLFKTN